MAHMICNTPFSGHLLILYGSQTCTAQEAAERIWRKSKTYDMRGPVQAMDDYSVRNLIFEHYAVFVCSTTGQGEVPDNMFKTWKFLKQKNLPTTALWKLKFGVLALGDSSYPKYNYAGKKLFRRLLQLGAKPLLDIGLCDYQHDLGHEAVMGPWIDNFFATFSSPKIEAGFFIPRWTVSLQDAEHVETPTDEKIAHDIYFSDDGSAYHLRVESNVRTTHESHSQDVRLIELKKKDDTRIYYRPGDVFNIRPRNTQEDIDDLFNIFETHNLNIKPDQILLVEQLHEGMAVPRHLISAEYPLTMRKVVEQLWDLRAFPSQYAFSLLAGVSEDALERDKCLELSSPTGYEDWLNYSRRPKRTILEVLHDFHKTCSKLTIEILFELFSNIKPRSFSIASYKHNQLDLLVAVVNYPGRLVKPRLGLCSNWLKDLQPGDELYGWISTGTFKFPKRARFYPMIMIGPGTGLAPFRSLIQYYDVKGSADSDVLHLFFGCRYKEKDFHCREELEQLAAEEKLSLYCAFSRDQDDKIYVQDKIAENGVLLWDLITMGALIYISGSAKNMPDAVKQAFVDHVFSRGPELAESYLESMLDEGKLQIETW